MILKILRIKNKFLYLGYNLITNLFFGFYIKGERKLGKLKETKVRTYLTELPETEKMKREL